MGNSLGKYVLEFCSPSHLLHSTPQPPTPSHIPHTPSPKTAPPPSLSGRRNIREYGTVSVCIPSGSAVHNLPAMQETQEMYARSLAQENPLEEEKATHSSTVAGKICSECAPGWEEPQGSIPKEQSFGGCAKFWTVVVRGRLRTQAAREAKAKPGSDSVRHTCEVDQAFSRKLEKYQWMRETQIPESAQVGRSSELRIGQSRPDSNRKGQVWNPQERWGSPRAQPGSPWTVVLNLGCTVKYLGCLENLPNWNSFPIQLSQKVWRSKARG